MGQKKATTQHESFCKEHCKNINVKYSEQPQRNDEIQNTVLDVEYIYIEPTPSTTPNHTIQR